jgi:hypothetical protein
LNGLCKADKTEHTFLSRASGLLKGHCFLEDFCPLSFWEKQHVDKDEYGAIVE